MEAGRDLDKLVVEKVFGYPVVVGKSPTNREDFYYVKDNSRFPVPTYSTHIKNAWEIVEHLQSRFIITIRTTSRGPKGSTFTPITLVTLTGESNVFEEKASSAPLALCLAALQVFEDLKT